MYFGVGDFDFCVFKICDVEDKNQVYAEYRNCIQYKLGFFRCLILTIKFNIIYILNIIIFFPFRNDNKIMF